MELIHAKFARRNFRAHRDDAGVPHVVAPSWREALYALGYLHALDRPTQLLFGRVVANGEAAGQIANNAELRETDRFFRKAGLYRHLEREIRQLDDDAFGQLTDYCEGVNDGLKQAGRSLPMWATRFHPEPWDQQSVLLIGNLLSYGGLAVGQQQNERLLVELAQTEIEPARLQELFAPRLDDADFDLLRSIKISHQLSDAALELITDLPRLAGSNAWAIAPARSATGHALLASDPHLEVNRLPAIWYEACLQWDSNYVLGATLPGCPLFAVARTNRLAWGVTYLKGDTSDFFVEDCRPGGASGWQYRRGQEWRDFELRSEEIALKGESSETLRIYESDVGTLDADPDEMGAGHYLASAWTGSSAGAGRSIVTWLDVIHAAGAREGMDIARECPHPSLAWVFADAHGHIGLQACGEFPRRRKGYTGLLPIPAWDERNHWQGRIPTSQLPSVFDPPAGFVATANEDLNAPGQPQLITLPLPNYRHRRIVERLAAEPQATLEAMQRLQYDVVSLQARDLLPVLLPHLAAGRFSELLSAWDCSYEPNSFSATAFQHLYRHVVRELVGETGMGWRRLLHLCTRAGYSTVVLTAIDELLQKETSIWWAGRDKGALIRRAAERAAHEREQPWSATNSFHFVNRFFENHRVGRMLGFHTAEMPMPGNHATPFQGHLLRTATRESSFAPSYHFVTDLGTNEAWTNLPGGASESRFSKYYKNDIPNWAAGKYKRLAPGE